MASIFISTLIMTDYTQESALKLVYCVDSFKHVTDIERIFPKCQSNETVVWFCFIIPYININSKSERPFTCNSFNLLCFGVDPILHQRLVIKNIKNLILKKRKFSNENWTIILHFLQKIIFSILSSMVVDLHHFW